jgi:hypothetical protein
MVDYAKAASDLKARMNAKTKRREDLSAFFETLRVSVQGEVNKANVELSKNQAPDIAMREEGFEEPTIELRCGGAVCQIAQDRSVPSVSASILGTRPLHPSAAKTVTFAILLDESPIAAQRVSLAPALEPKLDTEAIAATIVEELILEAS